ncbi:hypothetical protein V5799_012193 [Amblyomma americanum]|uniref:Uncharacterized protein n=1 Tax=Amblyomma americanum TaxID=6943 RepID=A0AAQ4EF38_AMBAM
MHTRAGSVRSLRKRETHFQYYMRAPTRFTTLACNTLLEKRTRQSTRKTSMYLLLLPNVWLDVMRCADLPEWIDALWGQRARTGQGI